MKTTWTTIRNAMGTALVLGLLAAPVTGTAQESSSLEAVNHRTARVLEEEAETRTASARTYLDAAELYRKAAAVRGPEDPRSIEDLRSAGRMAHYAGRHEQAVTDFREAGDRARKLGLANETLEAYYEAAWVAQRSEQYGVAYRLVQTIGVLSRDADFMWDVRPEVMARVMDLRARVG